MAYRDIGAATQRAHRSRHIPLVMLGMPPPFVAALPATQVTGGKPVMPAIDVQNQPVDQRLSDLIAGSPEDPLEGGAGNLHAFSRLGLIQPFEIFEPNCFQFFPKQPHLFSVTRMTPAFSGRPKMIALRDVIHHAPFVRSWHCAPSMMPAVMATLATASVLVGSFKVDKLGTDTLGDLFDLFASYARFENLQVGSGYTNDGVPGAARSI